ncbi:hypothetical protein EPN28_02520 [Patescibacteria group bacterium]|nr:MAG: hypothetical protein EPN28_02520 [Patescibacteria group bacterium]
MNIKEIADQQMPSITEWMEKIDFSNLAVFRDEDNNKRDRLEILNKILGIKYDKPEKMTARDIVDRTAVFFDILKRKGNQKCALRLVPLQPGLPKLRVRGKTLKENLLWFNSLDINPDDYKAEAIPHNDDTLFSAIFIVTDSGVWGEIAKGAHWQLTQGFYEEPPTIFYFDFANWLYSKNNAEIKKLTMEALRFLLVSADKHTLLREKLQAEFTSQGYLKGYFEFVVWPDNGISFIDYNRVLYKMFNNNFSSIFPKTKADIDGIGASPGRARGPARLVAKAEGAEFNDGEVLVCEMTTVDYVPLMKKAAAIVCEQGGLLSHAAIVARELKKPCVVRVKDAMKKIRDGDIIDVDGDTGRLA